MTSSNFQSDSISTVQLSPFAEEQWHRIVTYSPIYDHWTDMVLMRDGKRSLATHSRGASRKLNGKDPIDIHTLKLEDEIFLNELHGIRQAVIPPDSLSQPDQSVRSSLKHSNDESDRHLESPVDEYQTSSSDFFQPHDAASKKRGSVYTETSFLQLPSGARCPVSSNQSAIRPIISIGSIQKTAPINPTFQSQSSLSLQLRRSAMTREHAVSATYDPRTVMTLSSSSSFKRPINSAHCLQRPPPPGCRTSLSQGSASRNDLNSKSLHEQLTGESVSSFKRQRAKSSTSSRSAMHMQKTKNERFRQKQQVELKSLLVGPWKKPSWTDGTLEEAIPNSIDVMNQICGSATPFERNLRQNYHRQLSQYRTSKIQS